jgi:hypothetical protein
VVVNRNGRCRDSSIGVTWVVDHLEPIALAGVGDTDGVRYLLRESGVGCK